MGRRGPLILKHAGVGVDPPAVTRLGDRLSRARARVRSQRGFTLIEVMISALLVTLIAGAVAGALIGNADFSSDQHRRSEAQDLAQQDQERLKGLSSEQLDNLNQTYSATLDNTKFTVTSQAWYLNGTNGQACTAQGGANATYFKTISTVTWADPATGATQTLASDESVISPPAGGGILTEVHDQTTQPLSGVSVGASGSGLPSYAGTTDANGCTIFSAIESGTYTVSESDTGYVDPNGNASPLSTTANVSSTGLAWPQNGNPVEMGLGGGATGNFSISGATCSTCTGYADGLSWFSSGGAGIPMANYRDNPQSTTSSISTITKSGTSSIDGLFPFVSSLNPVTYTNNYQVWAGTCLQEEPPAGIDMVTVSPGTTSTPSILEPQLDLTTTYKASSGASAGYVAPSDVKITFTSTSGTTSCTDEWGSLASNSTNAGPSGTHYYEYGMPFASSATT
ncbi:MAG TPA: prepilin-type N-terminal cleavage/methylation domain-containing protein, partial [Solirubrobacteraceae bacterium]|nr:prepilin-type N-terminal cleavage/methylation domain-containing protein [Solirubrobacteraceae bacterium]